MQCKVCMQTFICTTSEVKCKEHAEAKHPKADLYTCFPHLKKWQLNCRVTCRLRLFVEYHYYVLCYSMSNFLIEEANIFKMYVARNSVKKMIFSIDIMIEADCWYYQEVSFQSFCHGFRKWEAIIMEAWISLLSNHFNSLNCGWKWDLIICLVCFQDRLEYFKPLSKGDVGKMLALRDFLLLFYYQTAKDINFLRTGS